MDSSKHQYHILSDVDQITQTLSALLKKGSDFAFDIETTSLDQNSGEILGIGLSWKPFTGIYISLMDRERGLFTGDLEPLYEASEENKIITTLSGLFVLSKGRKIAHNLDFELKWMIKKWDIEPTNTWDTMAYRSVEKSHKAKRKGYLRLGTVIQEHCPDLRGLKDIWEGVGEDKDLSKVYPPEKIGEYCCGDCDGTLRYYYINVEDSQDKPYKTLFPKRLVPSVHFINRINSNGIRVDRDYLNSKRTDLKKQKFEVLNVIQEEVGSLRFNPLSSRDLQSYFFNKLKAPRLRENHLDEPVLELYARDYGFSIATKILEYRGLSKLIATYFDGVERRINPTTGKVSADIMLWFTQTGRMSCFLHTLPSRQGPIVKRMFLPDDGYKLVGADYSQIELRLLTEYSQDPVLVKAYADGKRVHQLTASFLFDVPYSEITPAQDKIGKRGNFAWCYLGGAAVILQLGVGNAIMGEEYSRKLGITYEEMLKITIPYEVLLNRAKVLYKKYFDTYSGLVSYSERVIAQAKKDKFVVSSYGRMLHLDDIGHWDKGLRGKAERQAFNFKPQSTASDYLLFHFKDMIDVFDGEFLGVDPLLMVHDQAVMQVPEKNVDRVMELIPSLGVLPDESGITIPMVLEPDCGMNLGEV